MLGQMNGFSRSLNYQVTGGTATFIHLMMEALGRLWAGEALGLGVLFLKGKLFQMLLVLVCQDKEVGETSIPAE